MNKDREQNNMEQHKEKERQDIKRTQKSINEKQERQSTIGHRIVYRERNIERNRTQNSTKRNKDRDMEEHRERMNLEKG